MASAKNQFIHSFRIFIYIILLSAFCVIFQAFSSANDAPLAEMYSYNHAIASDSLGTLSALNNTYYTSSLSAELTNAGYNSHYYTNVPAGPKSNASVIRTLASDAVFIIHAHAGKGRMCCVSSSGSITRLSANSHPSNTVYSLQYNFQNSTDQLKYIRLAVWYGCNTHGTETDHNYGSLNLKSVSLGIDAVITHSSSAYPVYGAYYLYVLAKAFDDGDSVSAAVIDARTDTLCYYNVEPNDTTSPVYESAYHNLISGSATAFNTITLEPAAMGTY